MSLLFRNPVPSPRSAAPPSSFPSGLQPVGSRDRNGKGPGDVRRVSRTDMDFEQALRTDQTVVLHEGRDVNFLGDHSPTPSRSRSPVSSASASASRSPAMPPPATPTIVPPTPSPNRDHLGPSSSRPIPCTPTASTSSSTNDVFYDAEDTDYQTKRRSIYRSQGTASSPDLATLVRKAKQRGVLPPALTKDKRSEPPPPLPTSNSMNSPTTSPGKTRLRSSTSSFTGSASGPNSPMPSSSKKGKLLKHQYSGLVSPSPASPSGHDWAAASSGNLDGGTFKNAKASMRAKTSAFWGKMLGQGSVRDRSKSDAYSSSSSLRLDDAPPVPPIPSPQQRPAVSPISDVFSPPTSPPPSSNLSKPLPPIHHLQVVADRSATDFDFDDQSVVVVNHSPRRSRARSRSRSPEKTVRRKADTANKVSGHSKRRSMSVGEIDLKKAMADSSSTTPLPLSSKEMHATDDLGVKGVLSEFEGQLLQLDHPISTGSLDLQMPVTPPAHRKGFGHIPRPPPLRQAFSAPVPTFPPYERPETATTMTTAETVDSYVETPTVTVGLASAENSKEGDEEEGPQASPVDHPIVPPRSSSLHSPLPHRSRGTGPVGPRPFPPSTAARTLSGPRMSSYGSPHGHSPSRDSNRLWVNPRSAAFSSEPSLIPGGDDGGISPPLSALSQQDLTSHNHGLRRFPSNVTNNSQDHTDVETRGKELAARCWDEDEEFLAKEKIAEWLGGTGPVNKVALRCYMDRFDFGGLRLDLAFRRFCAKLFLKAETQQVDRILEEFSRRYWECNPGNLFGNPGVVHAVSYSLLLLNTDLHVADLATRMSKNQFVRNTLSTIQMQLQPTRSTAGSSSDLGYDDVGSTRSPSSDAGDTVKSRPKRSDSITSWNSITRDMVIANLGQSLGGPNTQGSAGSSGILMKNDSTISVSNTNTSNPESKTPSTLVSSITYDRNWESDMESLLKDMYTAIKNQQVLQPLSSVALAQGPIMRNRSLRVQPDRLTTLKRGSIRGIQSILGAQNAASPYGSNSSIDGRASPAPSFATSAHEGIHGSTLTFMTPALGFASNLSHTIIRETQEDDDRSHQSDDTADTTISITDEELALLGPPWAKEGILCRKQYNETSGKRAKSKAWLDVFVVIQKGELNMFTFGEHGGGNQGVVGGGNWLENAKPVGTVQLAHSLAHALPPPGYNRQRPHCMVLTLSNGAVYFFQAGTEELVNEWVSTCNYWAARQSKEPLTGGVSNMEYGWNRVADPLYHGRSLSDDESVRVADYGDNLSVRSGRSNRSKFGKRDPAATVRGGNSPWVDRTYINEWKEPQAPSVPSTHDEEGQLEALKKHVKALTKELAEHNELRAPMMALYPARSSNAAKALSNWEKRSKYLLTEIVKYELYIDSLQSAMALRFKKRGEKALERALHRDTLEDDDDPYSAKSKWKGRPDEETIAESDETTGGGKRGSLTHRREMAEVEEDEM